MCMNCIYIFNIHYILLGFVCDMHKPTCGEIHGSFITLQIPTVLSIQYEQNTGMKKNTNCFHIYVEMKTDIKYYIMISVIGDLLGGNFVFLMFHIHDISCMCISCIATIFVVCCCNAELKLN